jgi:hypothetical protein
MINLVLEFGGALKRRVFVEASIAEICSRSDVGNFACLSSRRGSFSEGCKGALGATTFLTGH